MKKFIITLNKSKISNSLSNEMIKHAKSLGIDGIEKFEATDRYKVWERYCDEEITLKNLKRMGGGFLSAEIATFFSHYDLWKKCLELNEPILILEHDAHFDWNPNVEQFMDFDGDVINLGIPNWGSFSFDDGVFMSKKNLQDVIHKLKVEGSEVSEDVIQKGMSKLYWENKPDGLRLRPICYKEHDVYRVWNDEGDFCHCDTMWLFGAHAYILTPKGANKLVKDIPNGILPADVFIGQDRVDIHDYLPHSVQQLSNKSFIQRLGNLTNGYNSSSYVWDY